MIGKIIRSLAHRWNKICYMSGYNDGYGQGHFDGFADVVFGVNASESDDDAERADFVSDDEIPF